MISYGDGENIKFVEYGNDSRIDRFKNTVKLSVNTNRVQIGIAGFDKDKDFLMVFQNSTYIEENIDYTISPDNSTIVKVDGSWDAGTEINFVVIYTMPLYSDAVALGVLKNTVSTTTDNQTKVFVGIEQYNPEYDELVVLQDNLQLYEGEQYTVNGDGSITLLYDVPTETAFHFIVMKKLRDNFPEGADGSTIAPGTVLDSALVPDARNGSNADLETEDKTNKVVAINEVNRNSLRTDSKLNSTGINVLFPPDGLEPLKGDYDYSTNTGSDDTEALQKIIDYAEPLGLEILFPPAMYYIGGDIQLKLGVRLNGISWQGSKMDNRLSLKGAVLIFKGEGATIYLGSNSAVENFTIFYPEQKWAIQNDATQSDGLEEFNVYKTTFVSNVLNGGAFTLNNLTVLGASDFYKQGENDLPMRFMISNIFGFITRCGIDIRMMYDMSKIVNVHFHATMCYGINDLRPGVSKVDKNTQSKILTSFTAFRLAKVDGILFDRCFSFGGNTFVETYVGADGGGAWAVFSNCHADTYKTILLVNSSGGKIIWDGGTFTPIVTRTDIDDGNPPSLLKVVGDSERNTIMFSNIETFGQKNGAFYDYMTNYCPTLYRIETNADKSNRIQVSNASHRNYSGAVAKTNSLNPISFVGTMLKTGKSYNLIVDNDSSTKYKDLTLKPGVTGSIQYRINHDREVTLIIRDVKNFSMGTALAQVSGDIRPHVTTVFPVAILGGGIANLEINSVTGEIVVGTSSKANTDTQTNGIRGQIKYDCIEDTLPL